LANGNYGTSYAKDAQYAVQSADALISALNEEVSDAANSI
jgi:hypothetical protein